jgi:hypothetical protein
VKERFFHIEFFRTGDDRYVSLEVNMLGCLLPGWICSNYILANGRQCAPRLFLTAGGVSLVVFFIATVAVLLLMYPLCRWYFSVKRSRPGSVLRYL